MPEGPEIRRAADRIAAVLVGRPLIEVWFAFPHLAPYADELTGQVVERLETRGKAMIFHFGSGLHLYTHNLLWGRWMVGTRGRLPRTNRSLRVALHTETHSALLYSASEIAVLDADALAAHPFLCRVGPDILDPRLTAPAIADRLSQPRFRGRTLAALLLDQGFLSGVGNYLRCEALFLARLSPLARAAGCTRAQHLSLGRGLLTVTRRAYETGGRTVDAGRGENGRHYVFRRAGRACLRCQNEIEGRDLNGRPLFWCPRCQPTSG